MGKKTSTAQYVLIRRRIRCLKNILGGKCAVCGSKENLSIEHKNGKAYRARKLSWWVRVRTYWREYNTGVSLELRCLSCNSAGGNYWSRFYEEQAAERLEKAGQWPPPPSVPEPIDENSRV